jgi:hypothetical protein
MRAAAVTGSARRGRALASLALLVACCGLVACGTPSPDLFVVVRNGTVPGAKLHMLVSDQSVRCNGAPAQELTSAQTLEARDILRVLLELQTAKTPLPPSAPAQIFSYSVRDEQGTLHYPDSQQRPAIIPRLTLFVRRVAIGTCHLQR